MPKYGCLSTQNGSFSSFPHRLTHREMDLIHRIFHRRRHDKPTQIKNLFLFGLPLFLSNLWLMFVSLLAILLDHYSLDRVLGYGLKHEDAYQNTHLGRIGNPHKVVP
jgi:hypothetical protein